MPPRGDVDLDYLTKLHEKHGFAVDWTADLSDVTEKRLWQYNVVVVYCEGAKGCHGGFNNDAAPTQMPELLGRYAAAGGGVFLLPDEMNIGMQMLQNTTEIFGAKLPAELMVADNEPFTGTANVIGGIPMTRMPAVHMQYTTNVPASPVSVGVKGCWFPNDMHYNSQNTNCLYLPPPWRSVLKASKDTHTSRRSTTLGTC